jgi:hypothetical protein
MTEVSQIHAPASAHLHAPPGLLYLRVDNLCDLGTPDVAYCLLGVSGWVEEKLLPARGAPKHLTLEQVTWGERWTRAGGRWFLLGKQKSTWLLYNASGARALYGGGEASPLVSAVGQFPRREVLEHLAPRELRILG